MESLTIGRDTFVKFMEAKLAGKVSITAVTEVQRNLLLNGLTIQFPKDSYKVGAHVVDLLAVLDVVVEETEDQPFPGRQAMLMCDDVLDALADCTTGQIYDATIPPTGGWRDGSYVSWPIEDLSFKDIPEDSYVRKNLSLNLWYFK